MIKLKFTIELWRLGRRVGRDAKYVLIWTLSSTTRVHECTRLDSNILYEPPWSQYCILIVNNLGSPYDYVR